MFFREHSRLLATRHVSNQSQWLRKYWSHMAEFTSWAAEHDGFDKKSFPISVYGDEASFGGTHTQRKFTLLALQSPLLQKEKGAQAICSVLKMFEALNLK